MTEAGRALEAGTEAATAALEPAAGTGNSAAPGGGLGCCDCAGYGVAPGFASWSNFRFPCTAVTCAVFTFSKRLNLPNSRRLVPSKVLGSKSLDGYPHVTLVGGNLATNANRSARTFGISLYCCYLCCIHFQ